MIKKTNWKFIITTLSIILFFYILLTSNSLALSNNENKMIVEVSSETQLRNAISSANSNDIIEIHSNINLLNQTPITIAKEITIQSKVNEDNNKYTIQQSNSKIRHFSIENNGKLVLENIILNGQNHGGGIQISSNGQIILNNGSILQNCLNEGNGGGIYIMNGSLIMNSGSLIENNSVSNGFNGGGIYAKGSSLNKSNIIINGGNITNNKTDEYGGGIFLSEHTIMNMYGGKISNNNAIKLGGGIVVSNTGSTFNMYDGTIDYNRSAKGGGIAMYNTGSLFIMKGGLISNNIATGTKSTGLGEGLGGGLYLNGGSQAKLYTGVLSKNTTIDEIGGHGGAIYTSSNTYLTIYNAIIKNNDAIQEGGGIWICNTGRVQVNEFRGMAIYNNNLEALYGGKDIHLDSIDTIVTLSNTALGNGLINWRNEMTNTLITDLVNLNGVLNIESEINQKDIERALQFSSVIIKENTSSKVGGGVAINGHITFGEIVPEKIDLNINKIWSNDSIIKRPDSIKIYLVVNGIKQLGEYIVLDNENNWTASFKDLQYKDNSGSVIIYSVEEEKLSNYTPEYTKLKINDEGNYEISILNTFSNEQELTDRKVIKEWDDLNNIHNQRPNNVTVQLYADNLEYGDAIILNSDNDWAHTWDKLPKNNDTGNEINYEIKEIKMEGLEVINNKVYNYSVSYKTNTISNVTKIINTYTTSDIIIEKTWKDNNNKYKLRPSKINVTIIGKNTQKTFNATLKGNDWTYIFKNVPLDDYIIKEASVKGYTSKFIVEGNKIKLINSLDVMDLKFEKNWEDNSDELEKRPNSVEIVLFKDGAKFKKIKINKSNNWKSDLNGIPIGNYFVKEINIVNGYVSSISNGGKINKYTSNIVITNTYKKNKTISQSLPSTGQNLMHISLISIVICATLLKCKSIINKKE